MATTRRLAAILAADVVGYSRLVGEDEPGTLDRIRRLRDGLTDPAVQSHHGRIFKHTGDGFLAEFASTVDAVRCARDIQSRMTIGNDGTPPGSRIELRMGVHQGDIVIEGDDVFGDGVNIAARLEALAEPGGIYVSARVQEDAIGKLDIGFRDLGEQRLRNIARPIHAYAIRMPPASRSVRERQAGRRSILWLSIAGFSVIGVLAAILWWPWPLPLQMFRSVAPPTAGSGQKAAVLSIVVLPLTNLSKDPEQDYFADAITDALTTDLSRIRNSFVIARTTAFTYKGQAVDARQIGRDLGVRHILEGSVRRVTERIQVNVQLIDAETGAHVWADRFDSDRRELV